MMKMTKSRTEAAAWTVHRSGATMWSLILGGFYNLLCFQILCPVGGRFFRRQAGDFRPRFLRLLPCWPLNSLSGGSASQLCR
eukprot:4321335-Pyramimonas_sp.AAC.1